MSLTDTLFNWLQLKIVADHRPNDEAARVSAEHMEKILREEHRANVTEVTKDGMKYRVRYEHEGDSKSMETPAEAAEMLLQFINDQPERYEFK